jgi:hypothetical protein
MSAVVFPLLVNSSKKRMCFSLIILCLIRSSTFCLPFWSVKESSRQTIFNLEPRSKEINVETLSRPPTGTMVILSLSEVLFSASRILEITVK